MLLRPFVGWKQIESQNLHSKPAQKLRGHTSDFTGAENPGCLAVEIETDQAVERKISVVNAVARARNFAIEREEQSNCVLRYRVRRAGRDACDRKPELGG